MKWTFLLASVLTAGTIACVSAKGDKPASAPTGPSAAEHPSSEHPAAEHPAAEHPVAAAEQAADCASDPNCVVEAWRNVDEKDLEEEPPAPTVVTAPPVVVHVPTGSPVGTSAGALTDADNAESRMRLLSQPTPPHTGTMGRFDVSSNPDADRKASLAARAALRAFEGAPPAMPHSSSYSSRSKTCLDCHLDGMTIGQRTAHPIPHPVMANCQQCHVELENKLYDELLTPNNSFEGQFFDREGEISIGGAPPMMPHGTFMRTKCLSCHGEFGYPGLRTPHPDRQNCMQCHITAMPK
jgi:cytochrome c-type protein NapB